MHIHHLNGMSFRRFHIQEITHFLLLETPGGIILIDAGLGLADYLHPSLVERLARMADGANGTMDETPVRQVARLGLDTAKVTDVVPTHLHFDHVGGAVDFPHAFLHVWEVELNAGLHPAGLKGLLGYFPERWKSHPGLKVYTLGAETWFGLPAMPVIRRDDVEIWLVPLTGHCPGHCGVAIKTETGWLWHCGDAYVRQCQVDPVNPKYAFPAIARWFEEFMFPHQSIEKIQKVLREHPEVTAICSHDPLSFADLNHPK